VNCGSAALHSVDGVGERVACNEHGRVGVEHRDVTPRVTGSSDHLQAEDLDTVGHRVHP
jgi:hypothetical protein